MFPMRPQRQRAMPLFPPVRPPARPFQSSRPVQKQQGLTSGIMAMMKNEDGKLDFEKITSTAQQVNKIYVQVKPLISNFIKK